jgi:uncharacterized BrkB/YihY/UPF0761 family membrane protein
MYRVNSVILTTVHKNIAWNLSILLLKSASIYSASLRKALRENYKNSNKDDFNVWRFNALSIFFLICVSVVPLYTYN